MSTNWIVGLVGIVAAIGVAGCGASPSAATINPTAVPTATPTATPTPTPNLTVTAAAAYLAAATKANAADAAIYKKYPKTFTSIAQAKRYWTAAEAVDRTFLTTIFAIAYPSFMKADVDAQIAAETKLVADEAASWNDLQARFPMQRIDHQAAYSLGGVYTNGAEEFFSRMRRAEIGHHHHIAGAYLVRYAQEAAWREDHRRTSNGRQVNAVMGLAMACPPSVDWCGYWQRSQSVA